MQNTHTDNDDNGWHFRQKHETAVRTVAVEPGHGGKYSTDWKTLFTNIFHSAEPNMWPRKAHSACEFNDRPHIGKYHVAGSITQQPR